jgi:autotransporter-associated beta strand protein
MNKPYKPSRSIRNFRMKATLASFAVLALSAQGLRAQSLTWDASGEGMATQSGTWTTATGTTDWNTAQDGSGTTTYWTNGDDAHFSVTGTTTSTVTLGTSISAAGLFFDVGATTVYGNSASNLLTIGADGITTAAGTSGTLEGSLVIGASQTWTLNTGLTANNYTNTSALDVTGASGAAVTLTIAGAGGLNTKDAFADGASGGTFALTINGGSLTQGSTATSTYSGGTNLLSGSARVTITTGLGVGTVTLGNTTGTAPATLTFVNGGTVANNFVVQGAGSSVIAVGGSGNTQTYTGGFTLNNTTALTIETSAGSGNTAVALNGAISGTGAISVNKTGNANLAVTLAGASSYSGGTTLSNGTMNVNYGGTSSTNSAIGTGTLTVTGGTIDNSSGAPVTLATNNAVTINGTLTYGGTGSLNLGTGAVSLGTASGTSRTINTNAATAGTALTIGGVISNGTTATGIIKGGTGTLVLNGVNLYTGTTSVTAGTLGGSGTIPGLLAMSGTSTLSPGPSAAVGSVGTLTVGSLTLSSTTSLLFDLGTNSDLITDNGALTLAGTVTATGGPGFGPGTYDLINYAGTLTNSGLAVSGSSTSGYTYTIDTSSTPGEVLLDVAVPEPSTVAMSLLALGALGFVLRRKAGSAIA